MRRIILTLSLALLTILFTSCSHEQPTQPGLDAAIVQTADTDQITAEIFHLTSWPVEVPEEMPEVDPEKCFGWIQDFEMTPLVDNIVHYRWDIRMGPEEMDVISLHRVVKVRRGRPVRTRKNIFLQHGDAKDFIGMFLPGTLSATTPDDFGAAVYWARRNVDVWGIDQAWANVPAETADLGFMAEWGMDKQSGDLGRAVAIARLVRVISGNGFGKMNLLGYSSGSSTGYALVNAETQLPRGRRQVGSWIPVDYSPISYDETWRVEANCAFLGEYEAMMDAGEYGYFVGFDFLGMLAVTDPDGMSPAFDGFTNLQAAMFVGAGQIFGVHDIHYLAGVWEGGLPVDFVHCSVDLWLDFMVAGVPWEPVRFMADYSIWSCLEEDVVWDDYLSEVEIPVLNVAAAGGIGPTTYDMLDLLGSDDVSSLDIQLLGDDEALFDFGHIDLWIADNAPELVWQPILDWVADHTPGHREEGFDLQN